MKLELTQEEILTAVKALKYCSFRRDLILDTEKEENVRRNIQAAIEAEDNLAGKLLRMVTEEKRKEKDCAAANPVV